MFKFRSKSGSYNDLIQLEGTIKVEEENQQQNCCCFQNLPDKSPGDPKTVVRYYKKAPVVTKESYGVRATELLAQQQSEPLLPGGSKIQARYDGLELEQQDQSCACSLLRTPSIKVSGSSKNSGEAVADCGPPSAKSILSSSFFRYDFSPKKNRSQSLKDPSKIPCTIVSFSGPSSHPSSPVIPHKGENRSPSPTSFISEAYLSASSNPQRSSLCSRKSSNASTFSDASSTFSTTSNVTAIVSPSARLFPAAEMPSTGKMRRVFTTHVRRRKKKKPGISFHLSNLMKEPLRVVHSVPLSFPPG